MYAPTQKRSPKWLSRAGEIAKRDGGWYCHYCKREMDKWTLTLDHKVPRCRGGTSQLENLVLSCHFCNNKKRDLDYDEFIAMVYSPPRWSPYTCCPHAPGEHYKKSSGGGCFTCPCEAYFQ